LSTSGESIKTGGLEMGSKGRKNIKKPKQQKEKNKRGK
jgi:hypothetical protein